MENQDFLNEIMADLIEFLTLTTSEMPLTTSEMPLTTSEMPLTTSEMLLTSSSFKQILCLKRYYLCLFK
ncbi:MAG: hypothetical protein KIT33_08065 [Candidatus Kapabacteria bacterium]|nr:hypothetical protein [Candidatus Kapabacteria bacterium]